MAALFLHKMPNLKSAMASMPRAIEKNDKRLLYYIHGTVIELLNHLDEEKREKERAKRENAQPIVEEIKKIQNKRIFFDYSLERMVNHKSSAYDESVFSSK